MDGVPARDGEEEAAPLRIKDTNRSERGSHADTPLTVLVDGWKPVLLRTWREIADDGVTLVAAGVTYYLLLAMFPTLTAFVSIYGLVTNSVTVAEHVTLLAGYIPGGFLNIIQDQLTALTQEGNATLGWGLVLSFALSLWSASNGLKTLFEAINVAYGEREKRNFLVLSALVLGVMLVTLILGVVMVGVVVVLPILLAAVGLPAGFEWMAQAGAYLCLTAVLFLALTVLYRLGPSRRPGRWRWLTPGAVFACVTIIAASLLFSIYAANFANYEKTYGSLGALIGLLTWMWICVTVVIVGAELNAEIEQQRTQVGSEMSGPELSVLPDVPRPDAPHVPILEQRKLKVGALALAIPAALVLGWFARRSGSRSNHERT